MITARGYIKEPKEVTVVVTLEMTVKELVQIRKHLDDNKLEYWPYRKMADALGEVARQVETMAYANSPSEQPEK